MNNFYFLLRKVRSSYLVIFISCLHIFSCSWAKKPTKWTKKGIVPQSREISLSVGTTGRRLTVIYTGCGGLVVDNGKELILTDPFFSYQPFWSIMLGKIWVSPNEVQNGLADLEQAGIGKERNKHLFIAHSHYDHLMDVPFLLEKKWLNENDKIYGSTTTYNILKKFLPEDSSFKNLEFSAFRPANNYIQKDKWIWISNELRVLPILSDHAPHFLNIELMQGEVGPSGIPNFNSATDKTKATAWKGGEVYSFLLDIMEKDKTVLRVFIQSSSGKSPQGFPPKDELKRKSVDVAFLGVASSNNVKNYPHELLRLIRPSKILLIHWEDFFMSKRTEPRTVRMTNFNKFLKRLRNVEHVKTTEDLKGKVIMPLPGTEIHIAY